MPGNQRVTLGGPKGIRIPTECHKNINGSPVFATLKMVSHSYASAHADWNLTYSEACGSVLYVTSASGGGAAAVLPVAEPGRFWILVNNSGQTVTLKISGVGSGVSVADGKTAILWCGTAEIYRITADT